MKLILGDSLQKLKDLPTSTIDCVVTDPPWAIKFMSRQWDYDIPSVDLWREVLRVLKPGGHILVCCGTRTQHRMIVNVEDAGFEVRDVICHLYGSGFPKSLDVSKAIDKAAGAEHLREFSHKNPADRPYTHAVGETSTGWQSPVRPDKTTPATDDAKRWQGWGTALKPACEFWTLARKPLEKGLTVAENVLKWGTGALAIDACRIGLAQGEQAPTGSGDRTGGDKYAQDEWTRTQMKNGGNVTPAQGRWPANLILDDESARLLDEQSGVLKSGSRAISAKQSPGTTFDVGTRNVELQNQFANSSGGASRFFYVAKASKRERLGSKHPTIKPVKLMRYLVRLVCPPNGICLDPFMGSGTTGVACVHEGREFIGIEREEEYIADASRRIEHAQRPEQLELEGGA